MSLVQSVYSEALFEVIVKLSLQRNRLCLFCLQVQVNNWQLISVHINRQCQSDISVIAENCLDLFACTHVFLTCFPSMKTKYWDVPNLELPGYVCDGSKSGFATLLVSKQFQTMRRSWRHEERCTAIPFGSTLVMAVYAADSGKDMDLYEAPP